MIELNRGTPRHFVGYLIMCEAEWAVPSATGKIAVPRMIYWGTPPCMAWRCGMIHVVDGYQLTPQDHARLISERVQELHDRVPWREAQRIVQDLAVDVGDARLNSVPSPEEMGDSLVEYLKPNLLERGALIERPVVCTAHPDITQDDWDEMTFETWVANAA